MNTLAADKAFAKIQRGAERIRNDEPATIGTVSIGDVVRQGDLYVVAIEALPEVLRPLKSRQLAPGHTRGSRHILVGDAEIFEPNKDQVLAVIARALAPRNFESYAPLVGPVFRTIGQCELDHPEHGNRLLPAGDCFAVIYQRAFGREVQRQQD